MLAFGGGGWGAWRRGADYYDEGVLIWLEVDTRLRELTHGERSLDDFCRAFFGGGTGQAEVKPYTFDDVVAALNSIAPYDWKTLLNERLTATRPQAPLDGYSRSGWRLAYGDKPTELETLTASARKLIDHAATLGLKLTPDGTVADVIPAKAADRAGVGPGMKVLSVNSRRWSAERLAEAVRTSKTNREPIELILENRDYLRVYRLDYHDGARHPRLERTAGKKDLLAEILKPRSLPATGATK
jgi:predicted metalloprotease with PDZ domain